jgi:hypothetical protein
VGQLRIPVGFANAHYRFSFAGSSHTFSFALAYEATDVIDPIADAETLSEAFSGSPGYEMGSIYNAWTFHGVHLVVGNDGPDLIGDFDPALPGTGGSGSFNPPNTSMLVKKTTLFAGRKFRGRMYFPLISLVEADVDNVGNIDSTVRGVIQASVNDWLTQTSVTVPNFEGFRLLHEGITPPTAIETFVVESMVATQRRRLR